MKLDGNLVRGQLAAAELEKIKTRRCLSAGDDENLGNRNRAEIRVLADNDATACD
jgi:hypothetical protein